MEREQVKEKIINFITTNELKLRKCFRIAMVCLLVIIAIIFVNIITIINNNEKKALKENDVNNIEFAVCDSYDIYKFIADYFKARNKLDFNKIFKAYGRDYYKEKYFDTNGRIKKIEDTIRYERTFIKDYENIRVYCIDGYRDGDVVCVVTYDLAFGFTDEEAPMIIMFYLEKKGDSYIIKENFDVGVSKYIMKCMNKPFVKELYDDVNIRLTRLLMSSESLKLAYNSLRQYEMNLDKDINYKTNKFVDNYNIKKLDPILDFEIICKEISAKKKEKEKKDRIDSLVNGMINSMKASNSIEGN